MLVLGLSIPVRGRRGSRLCVRRPWRRRVRSRRPCRQRTVERAVGLREALQLLLRRLPFDDGPFDLGGVGRVVSQPPGQDVERPAAGVSRRSVSAKARKRSVRASGVVTAPCSIASSSSPMQERARSSPAASIHAPRPSYPSPPRASRSPSVAASACWSRCIPRRSPVSLRWTEL